MTSQQLSKSPLAPQGNVQILGILLCMHHFVTIVRPTLDSGINVGVRLLIFGLFSSGYVLIKGGTFINFFIFHLFNIFLNFFSFSYV